MFSFLSKIKDILPKAKNTASVIYIITKKIIETCEELSNIDINGDGKIGNGG